MIAICLQGLYLKLNYAASQRNLDKTNVKLWLVIYFSPSQMLVSLSNNISLKVKKKITNYLYQII